MRILVFDDSRINRAAAHAQLNEHELTVVGTYSEAQELLLPQINRWKAGTILENQFGVNFDFYSPENKDKQAEYLAAKEVANQQATTYPDFDIVLTDLLVPASSNMQSSQELVGKEMPVGIFIGLLAAVKARAKYIAVFTDTDHHSHPASACFDAFNHKGEDFPSAFTVEGSQVFLCNAKNWVGYFDPNDFKKELSYEESTKRTDTVRAKNWRKLLKYLVR